MPPTASFERSWTRNLATGNDRRPGRALGGCGGSSPLHGDYMTLIAWPHRKSLRVVLRPPVLGLLLCPRLPELNLAE
jgi:hypothetical protein